MFGLFEKLKSPPEIGSRCYSRTQALKRGNQPKVKNGKKFIRGLCDYDVAPLPGSMGGGGRFVSVSPPGNS